MDRFRQQRQHGLMKRTPRLNHAVSRATARGGRPQWPLKLSETKNAVSAHQRTPTERIRWFVKPGVSDFLRRLFFAYDFLEESASKAKQRAAVHF